MADAWAARLAALAAGPLTRPALARAARLVAAAEPGVAGLWALAEGGEPLVAGVDRPAVRDALLERLGRGGRANVFAVALEGARLRVTVVRDRGRVLGGAILSERARDAVVSQLGDLLRLWLGREAARAEAVAQAHGLELVRALAEGLLEVGESPLGLDQLFVRLRNIVPCELLSLALPVEKGFQAIHVVPAGLDARVVAAMQRELEPALGGQLCRIDVERVAGGRAPARANRPRLGSSIVLPVPDPEGGAPGFLGLYTFRPGGLSTGHVHAVAQLMPGLARALATARVVRAREVAERESRAEMGRARELQLSMARGQRRFDGFDLAVGSAPFAGVSGDFHQVRELAGCRLAVLVADVCGHGVASALEAAFLQGVLATEGTGMRGPAARLARLNEALCARGGGSDTLLVSGLAVELDAARGTLAHCEAGHPAPLVVRGGRVFEPESAEPDDGHGHVLLGVTTEWRGRTAVATLEAGDLIVLYTDGVIEAEGAGERFGKERLKARCAGLGAGTAAAAVATIEGTLEDFCAGTPAHDDRTVIAVRVS